MTRAILYGVENHKNFTHISTNAHFRSLITTRAVPILGIQIDAIPLTTKPAVYHHPINIELPAWRTGKTTKHQTRPGATTQYIVLKFASLFFVEALRFPFWQRQPNILEALWWKIWQETRRRETEMTAAVSGASSLWDSCFDSRILYSRFYIQNVALDGFFFFSLCCRIVVGEGIAILVVLYKICS